MRADIYLVQTKTARAMRPPDISGVVDLTYDEIIFQTRNRAYGAFELRRQYQPTLTRALGLGVGLFLAGLSAPMVYAWLSPTNPFVSNQVMIEAKVMKLPEPPINEVRVPIPPVDMPVVQSTIEHRMPVVVMDAPEDMPIATVEELVNAVPGQQTAEGTGVEEVIAAPEASIPTHKEIAVEVAPKTDEVFTAVEQQPEYPGGVGALNTFLTKNLSYPRLAANAGVSGRVYISFVVNTDGSLTDVQMLKGIGFGCDEEAVRVIQKMPHWRPGKQSGRAVRVKFNLPIAFTLE